jgi:hypothetical protein
MLQMWRRWRKSIMSELLTSFLNEMTHIHSYQISCFRVCECSDFDILGYDTMKFCKWIPTFRCEVLLPLLLLKWVSEWQESVDELCTQTGRQRWCSLRTTGKSDRGPSGSREAVTWNGEEQSFHVRMKTNLRHCHIADGLWEAWMRERRQTEACLFCLRENALSHSFVSRVSIAPVVKDRTPSSPPSPDYEWTSSSSSCLHTLTTILSP